MPLSHTWFFDRLKKRASRPARGYPIASVAFYGPTEQIASKVVVGITAIEVADVAPSSGGTHQIRTRARIHNC